MAGRATGFGQPEAGILQIAYVVDDLHAAIEAWLAEGVGPWYVLDRWLPEDGLYRGEVNRAEIAAALAFSGHTQIELLQPLDDHPSVYREVLEERGAGFHHIARGAAEFDVEVASYRERGFALAFSAVVGTGSRVAYLDTRSTMPGFVELIETTPANDAFFTAIYEAAKTWDGSAPVRPFEALRY
ncbi:VOC family protein [Sphingomonas sp. CGMCC 1.13654]|uniref:VOC family protein n=1 Tax=Sphingomonas chungangi TaxID=2683589 RepID=A0A838L5L0_9SPHN|nr:VOC family protein [Sphingomonas chungangi]